MFDTPPETVPGAPTATYTGSQVDLTWALVPNTSYRIYRVDNQVDKKILEESKDVGYAPPGKLRLGTDILSENTYADTQITVGATYWYGITVVDENNIESPISGLSEVFISPTSPAAEKEEAISRGLAWLRSQQNEKGYWGDKEGTRILATTQALNAFRLTGADNAAIRKGLFWLRGHYADNNDYLARKIITLNNAGQNVDEATNRLVSQGEIQSDDTIVYGWGVQKSYLWTPLTTVLGSLAIKRATVEPDQYHGGFESLKNHDQSYWHSMRSAEDDKFGWVIGKDPSVFVSAHAYSILLEHFDNEESVFDRQWIINSQNSDGSFGNGLIDTAAVHLRLNTPLVSQDNAANYIIGLQLLTNGSWGDDPYLSGLALEALLPGAALVTDTKILPSSVFDADIYVDAVAGSDSGNCDMPETGACQTISAAIDKALNAQTIAVASGTYYEGIVSIDKSLTIIGDFNEKPVIKPTTNTGTDVNSIGAGGCGWFRIHDNAMVKIENMVFDGSGKNIHTAVHYHSDSGGGTVNNCDFKHMRYSNYKGRAINNFGKEVSVVNSTFADIERIAIFTYNAGAETTITGCTFTGNGPGDYLQYCIEVNNNGKVYINGNKFSGYRGQVNNWKSSSIIMYTSGNTVTNNLFNDCYKAIRNSHSVNTTTNNTFTSCNYDIMN